ncbi:MAG: Omp28-related outer membrane protein [Bacteroidetes bacterium]|jgi:hypothetical protein|nr:Omp28-related outer membrane protein [Bacteroidota bacterium]MBK9320269.1 Omp28-related outer membrane protein [Bacteroidota bacterium]
MKKLLVYAAASGFLFTACQKEDPSVPESQSGSKAPTTVNVSPVPATFQKKVLIEEITSTTSGTAPQSALDISNLLRANPGKVYAVGMHTNDFMANVQSNRLLNSYSTNQTTIPCALISRLNYAGGTCLSPNLYTNAVNGSLLKPAVSGLAINSVINGRAAQIDVHCGFTSVLNGSYKVTTYLVEDFVTNANTAFYQANSYNTTVGSPFYNLGNPIINYTHNNVVRMVVSNSSGDDINPMSQVPGGSDVRSYRIDLPQKHSRSSKWYVVSFITSNTTNEVLNVQSGLLGTLKDWN